MVTQLMRLQVQTTWNTVRRQTATLILTILAIIFYAIPLLVMGFAAAIVTGIDGQENIFSLACILFGSACLIICFLYPFFMPSSQGYLAPHRFAPYCAPSRKLARALIPASSMSIAGIGFTIASLIPTVNWIAAGKFFIAPIALLCSLIAVLTGFALSRVAVGIISLLMAQNSKVRKNISFLVGCIILVALMTNTIWSKPVFGFFAASDRYISIAHFLSWTPFGAAWSIPQSINKGSWATAAIQLCVACVSLALTYELWVRMFPSIMSGNRSKINAKAAKALNEGRHVIDESQADSNSSTISGDAIRPNNKNERAQSLPGLRGVGFFEKIGCSEPTASQAMKTLHYWLHDKRFAGTIIAPVMFAFISIVMTNQRDSELWPPVIYLFFGPFVLGQFVGVLMQYDSTAAWILVSSPIRGRQERLGRVLGSLPIVLPIILVAPPISGYFTGYDRETIIRLTSAILLFFCCTAASQLIVGARWVYPVPPPGSSPFGMNMSSGKGSFITTMFIQFGVLGLSLPLLAPGGILLGLSQWAHNIPPIFAVGFTLLWSLLVIFVSVIISGKVWDKYSSNALTKMSSWPGHKV